MSELIKRQKAAVAQAGEEFVAVQTMGGRIGWFRALDRACPSRRKSAPLLALALGLDEHH